ncbi:MAG TPA: hypothetical protein VJV05_05625 [Pyrinomonadaceae bacterium]|nr:hypothetical protein [Pyrinomonadaceae bacterium]
MVNADDLVASLRCRIDSHFEWLLVRPTGRTFPLRRDEIYVISQGERVMFGVLDDSGFNSFRVRSIADAGEELLLDLGSRSDSVVETIRLLPRTPARELSFNVDLARLERANLIGAALVRLFPSVKLIRIALNHENGRLAQIIVREPSGKEAALLSDVTGSMIHEAILTTAITWSDKLRRRKKPVNEVWIAGERKQVRNLRKLMGLLNPNVAGRFRMFEITNGDELELKELKTPSLSDLWREKPKKITLPNEMRPSETAERIRELAPDKTDIIFSYQGETVRFQGLPFARIRTVAGRERAWFGIDHRRLLNDDDDWSDLATLVADLEMYRSARTPNKRHEVYRYAPEAWLESILRRNIKLLDTNLILSPIYNQFRASTDKIDLLAIRRDGRLVIIELKTSPDREMVFQAADYWRKIELQRRRGVLARMRAFGDTEILDKPALVYAVAPALSFHLDFPLYAASLRKEIEVWRFDLHQDWRSEIKVLTRRDYASSGTYL